MQNCVKDEGDNGSDPSVRWILREMITSGHSADHSRIQSPHGLLWPARKLRAQRWSENEFGLLRGGTKVTLEDPVSLQVVLL